MALNIICKRSKDMCFYVLDFLAARIFLWSASIRIYEIAVLLLTGSFAEASTSLAGQYFFYGSIAISLTLGLIHLLINHIDDSQMRAGDKKIEESLNLSIDSKQQEKLTQRIITEDPDNDYFSPKKQNWTYFINIVVIFAAMMNIMDELTRWEAVLPISTHWVVANFTLLLSFFVIAAICLNWHYKNNYSDKVLGIRQFNTIMMKAAQVWAADKMKEFKKEMKDVESLNPYTGEATYTLLRPVPTTRYFKDTKQTGLSEWLKKLIPFALATGAFISGSILISIFLLPLLSEGLHNPSFFLAIGFVALASAIIFYIIHERLRKIESPEHLRKALNSPAAWNVYRYLSALTIGIGVGGSVCYALAANLGFATSIIAGGSIGLSATVLFLFIWMGFSHWHHSIEAERKQHRARDQAREKKLIAELKEKGITSAEEKGKFLHLLFQVQAFNNGKKFQSHLSIAGIFYDRIAIPIYNTVATTFPIFFVIDIITNFLLGVPRVYPLFWNHPMYFTIEILIALFMGLYYARTKFIDGKFDRWFSESAELVEAMGESYKKILKANPVTASVFQDSTSLYMVINSSPDESQSRSAVINANLSEEALSVQV